MAVGALAALAEAGAAVPEEMSVAGFDDIPIARYVTPPLTTIRIDVADLGRRALGLLLDAIRRPSATARRRDSLATTLVVRGSCRSPRTSAAPGPRPGPAPRARTKGEKP
jgi:LacI family transcriptional regulator